MRHLHSEHISGIAALMYTPGKSVRDTVQLAIELQQEANRQCEKINEQLDKEDGR